MKMSKLGLLLIWKTVILCLNNYNSKNRLGFGDMENSVTWILVLTLAKYI